jgi:hypothetical protein
VLIYKVNIKKHKFKIYWIQLDKDLIGLIPVKTRIREIAALLLVDRLRKYLV